MRVIYPPSDLLDWCQRIYGPGRRLLLTEYTIPVQFAQVAPGARDTQQVQIQQNADFVLLGFGFGFDSAVGQPNNSKLFITDSATGEQFSNTAVSFSNLLIPALNAGEPCFNLPYPKWLGGNTSLSLELQQDATAGGDVLLSIDLRGFLVRELAGA